MAASTFLVFSFHFSPYRALDYHTFQMLTGSVVIIATSLLVIAMVLVNPQPEGLIFSNKL